MNACTKHAAKPVRGYSDCPGCEVESLRQQLAAAQAELSADAKWQAVIDQIADDEDRMHEQIELWARQSYRRSRSGVRGTTITRADSEVTHYVWAALRWAHEREQAEAQELRERAEKAERKLSLLICNDCHDKCSVPYRGLFDSQHPDEEPCVLCELEKRIDAALSPAPEPAAPAPELPVTCPVCNGSGIQGYHMHAPQEDAIEWLRCRRCDGFGHSPAAQESGDA